MSYPQPKSQPLCYVVFSRYKTACAEAVRTYGPGPGQELEAQAFCIANTNDTTYFYYSIKEFFPYVELPIIDPTIDPVVVSWVI